MEFKVTECEYEKCPFFYYATITSPGDCTLDDGTFEMWEFRKFGKKRFPSKCPLNKNKVTVLKVKPKNEKEI